MKLWLVRHAQPLIEPGVCYGAADVPADARATALQACQLAEVLPAGVRVFSSPLQRCESLALALCRLRPDLVYESDARLREMDFGNWEGRRWDEIPRAEFDAWMDDFAQYSVGGGENVKTLMKRVELALSNALSGASTPGELAKGEAVWITHAGVIRAATLLIAGITRLTDSSQWPTAAPGFGEWLEFTLASRAGHARGTRICFG